MPQHTIETLLCASRLDIDSQSEITAGCEDHAIAEHQLRAVIATFRPLSDSLEIFLTR